MRLSDESGLIESEMKEILNRIQVHSMKKLEDSRRFNNEGIAKFKIKIIGNNNRLLPVIIPHHCLPLLVMSQIIFFLRNRLTKDWKFK
jgi:hypothetical protein